MTRQLRRLFNADCALLLFPTFDSSWVHDDHVGRAEVAVNDEAKSGFVEWPLGLSADGIVGAQPSRKKKWAILAIVAMVGLVVALYIYAKSGADAPTGEGSPPAKKRRRRRRKPGGSAGNGAAPAGE